MAKNNVRVIIEAIDRFTAPARRISQSLQRLGRVQALRGAFTEVGARLGDVSRAGRGLVKTFGLLGLGAGGAGALLTRNLVQTGAEFERFETILETVEGSSEAAKKSLAWVSDFAAKTPFELNEVMGAFVKLRTFGLDPTNGLLRTLGDTAAAMGKPINQAVEALADAVTGENERLKEFGIKARTVGKQVVFEFSANGKTLRKIARVGNRAQIQSTLEAIWNEKYAGAMDKQSRTWIGMMSNIGDQWTRFKILILNSGVFEWLKGKLAMILERINQMAASGELQKLATEIGVNLVAGLKAAWSAGKALWAVLKVIGAVLGFVADLVGGFRNLAILLAAVIAGKLIVALASLAVALKAVFILLAANPIVAVALLLAAAAALIIRNWEPIKAFFTDLWNNPKRAFEDFVNFGTDMLGRFGNWIGDWILKLNDSLPAWFKYSTPVGLGINLAAKGIERARTTVPTVAAAGARPGQTDVGGLIRIQFDGDGRPRVRGMENNNPNVDFDVGGTMMVAP